MFSLIAAIAFTVRFVYVLETADVPFVRYPVGDAAGYYEWARTIAADHWIGHEPFYQAPLYPYVLAIVFKLFGDSTTTIRLTQAAFGAIACAALACATARWFDRRTGIVAGLMLALYAPAIFYDGIIQKASLDALLLCLLLWVMSGQCSTKGPPGNRRAAALGALAALLSLSRENALIWLPVLFAWVIQPFGGGENDRRRNPIHMEQQVSIYGTIRLSLRHSLTVGTAFLIAAAVVLTPVGLRNRMISGQWSFTTFQAGPNFYIGNHRGADGRYVPLIRGHETPAFERADATRLAENAMGRPLTPREVSRYWMSRGWQDIKADPFAWLGLLARKTLMVLNRYEVADAESITVYAQSSHTLTVLSPIFHFGTMAPLSILGIAATRRYWRRLAVLHAMMLTMIAAVTAFFVLGRYRYPLVPLLVPFAAVGICQLWDHLRAGQFRTVGVSFVTLFLSALLINWPLHDVRRLDALAQMNAGVALAQHNHVAEAQPWFERALAAHPDSPEANNNLAQVLAVHGEFDRAIMHYKRALDIEPPLPGIHYNLGVALERVGRTDEAAIHYHQAILNDPADTDARAALQRLQLAD